MQGRFRVGLNCSAPLIAAQRSAGQNERPGFRVGFFFAMRPSSSQSDRVDPALEQRFRIAVLGQIADDLGPGGTSQPRSVSRGRPMSSQEPSYPVYDSEGFTRTHRAMSRRRRKWQEHTTGQRAKTPQKVWRFSRMPQPCTYLILSHMSKNSSGAAIDNASTYFLAGASYKGSSRLLPGDDVPSGRPTSCGSGRAHPVYP